MRVAIVSLGTRGDVQPYVALALGLRRAGHAVRLFSTRDFAGFVGGYGLDFHGMNADARELLGGDLIREAVAGGTVGMAARLVRTYRVLLDELYGDFRAAAEWGDALVLGPIAAPAAHPAEGLGKRVCGAYLQPWTATAAFSHANFAKFGCHFPGWYNRLTAWVVAGTAWWMGRPVLNRWRADRLGLRRRSVVGGARDLAGQPWPVLYGFSPRVVPKPADWGRHVRVTGYWFLDRPPGWEPPGDLVRFLDTGPPPVYVGFGSWPVPDPAHAARTVVAALARAGCRAVLYPGWAGTGGVKLPGSVYVADGVPHDWLFPRVAAAVHHGGAGTTAAALRAGVPSVVVPFEGDQFFWGRRVEALKAGPRMVPYRKLTAERLAGAIRRATTDPVLRDSTAALGEGVRKEDGVGEAVRAFDEWFGSV